MWENGEGKNAGEGKVGVGKHILASTVDAVLHVGTGAGVGRRFLVLLGVRVGMGIGVEEVVDSAKETEDMKELVITEGLVAVDAARIGGPRGIATGLTRVGGHSAVANSCRARGSGTRSRTVVCTACIR
jgi:hypothetical protein